MYCSGLEKEGNCLPFGYSCGLGYYQDLSKNQCNSKALDAPQLACVLKRSKVRSQAGMFLTSGYILIVHVLVKLDRNHTLKEKFGGK